MSKFIFFLAILCIVFLEVSLAEICPTSSLKIEQTATGHSVQSKPEWKVKVSSSCKCTLTLVKLFCPKFLSSIEVKPPVISLDGEGHCILKGMNPLHYNESIDFTYAWDPIDFKVLEFDVACS